MDYFESYEELEKYLEKRDDFLSSAESSELDCKEEFDEEFNSYQPPPLNIDPKVHKIKEIAPSSLSFADAVKQNKECPLQNKECPVQNKECLLQNKECNPDNSSPTSKISKNKKKRMRRKKQKDANAKELIAETLTKDSTLEANQSGVKKKRTTEENSCFQNVENTYTQNLQCDQNYPKLPSADVNKVVPPYKFSQLEREKLVSKIIHCFAKLEATVLQNLNNPELVDFFQKEFLQELNDLKVPYVSTYDNFCCNVLNLSETYKSLNFTYSGESLSLPLHMECCETYNMDQFEKSENDFLISFVRQRFELYARRLAYIMELFCGGTIQSPPVNNICENVPYKKNKHQKVLQGQTELSPLIIDDLTRNRKYFYENDSDFKKKYELFCGDTIQSLPVNTSKKVRYKKPTRQNVLREQIELSPLIIDDLTRHRKYFCGDTYNDSDLKQFYELFCGGTTQSLSVINEENIQDNISNNTDNTIADIDLTCKKEIDDEKTVNKKRDTQTENDVVVLNLNEEHTKDDLVQNTFYKTENLAINVIDIVKGTNQNIDIQNNENISPILNDEHNKDDTFYIESSSIEIPLLWVLNLTNLKSFIAWIFVLLMLKNGILSFLYYLLFILNYVDLIFFLSLFFYMCILFVVKF